MKIFADDADYRAYLELVAAGCKAAGTEVWAYCLMPNHIHLILVPACEDGLRSALGEAHRRYTRMINFREKCRGHLWQERFHSFPMDETYLNICARYVELNPVRAGLVAKAEDWAWSSAGAHLAGKDDGLASVKPMLTCIPDWQGFLAAGVKDAELKTVHIHTITGRPLGVEAWIRALEAGAGRALMANPPGRPKAVKNKIYI